MFAAASAFDQTTPSGLQSIRAVGGLQISTSGDANMTALRTLHEFGGYRIKCAEPRAAVLEAVMINTGGGVAGGDRISISATAASRSRLALTTATAERIYRATGEATTIDVQLSVADDAKLAWLPQATIAFSGARLTRRINATVSATGRLLIVETTAYGRKASGEIMTAGRLQDHWRIVRDDRMVFADATCLSGNVDALLQRAAVADGRAIATLLVCIAPEAESRRDDVGDAIAAHNVLAGVSAWNGILTVRLLGDRMDHIANALRGAVAALNIMPLPAAWTH